MKRLRMHVERVVRPIRAIHGRKDKMREELLAHLTGIYDEELARLGDKAAAVDQAIRRFGDAEELRRDLQTSVPLIERLLFVQIPPMNRLEQYARRTWSLRAGETTLHYAARAALRGCVVLFVAMLVEILVLLIIKGSLAALTLLGLVPRFLPLAALHGFLCSLFICELRHALKDGSGALASRVSACGYGIVWSLLIAASGFLFSLMVKEGAIFDRGHLNLLLAIAVLCPVVAALCARISVAEDRHHEEWGNLEIGD